MKYSFEELISLTEKESGKFFVSNEKEAELFTKKRALSHYENFPVGSVLIPKKHRNHIFNIYAFARIADDIADEYTSIDATVRTAMLNDFEALLYDTDIRLNCSGNPVFVAVNKTIRDRNIPPASFAKLLAAFNMDINFRQAENFDELLEYCSYSANPVGELVLRVFDFYNEQTAGYSDMICTGLQLVNFWQDFSVDIPKGRLFIPKNYLDPLGIDFEKKFSLILQNDKMIHKLSDCLNDLYDVTEKYLIEGSDLINELPSLRLRAEIAVTVEAGIAILKKVRELGTEIFKKRPDLKKFDYFKILVKAFSKHRVFFNGSYNTNRIS